MSKIPIVFTRIKMTNHLLCESLAAFHKAIPFQGIVHNVKRIKSQNGKPSNVCII